MSLFKEGIGITNGADRVDMSYGRFDYLMKKHAPKSYKKYNLKNAHEGLSGIMDAGPIQRAVADSLATELARSLEKVRSDEDYETVYEISNLIKIMNSRDIYQESINVENKMSNEFERMFTNNDIKYLLTSAKYK